VVNLRRRKVRFIPHFEREWRRVERARRRRRALQAEMKELGRVLKYARKMLCGERVGWPERSRRVEATGGSAGSRR
jgi:hypothetical protein